MATDIVPSNVNVANNPTTYSISIVNNLLENVQTHDYPSYWYHEDLKRKFHGAALVDPVFVSHDSSYSMWEEGQPASRGIGLASLYGTSSHCKLFREIEKTDPAHIGDFVTGRSSVASERDADDRHFVSDPRDVVTDYLDVDADHPMISSFFKIMPSPCWFSGFHDLQPVTDDGMWYDEFTVPAYPYTTNWATGTEYLDQFSREMKEPAGDITRLTPDTIPKHSKVFLDKHKESVPPVAYVKFERVTRAKEDKSEERIDANPDENTRKKRAKDSNHKERDVDTEDTNGKEEKKFWTRRTIVATVVPLVMIFGVAIGFVADRIARRTGYQRVRTGEQRRNLVV